MGISLKLGSFKSETSRSTTSIIDVFTGIFCFSVLSYHVFWLFGKYGSWRSFIASIASNLYFVKSDNDSLKPDKYRKLLTEAQIELGKLNQDGTTKKKPSARKNINVSADDIISSNLSLNKQNLSDENLLYGGLNDSKDHKLAFSNTS